MDAPFRPSGTVLRLRVWDLPTRLFHWLLAASVPLSLATAYTGGDAMAWHFRLGYLALTLLLFRGVWGLVGGHWSRFSSFAYRPSALARYLRGHSTASDHHEIGHSPLGALSVYALLAVLAVQVASGLFADDEIAVAGPLVPLVDSGTSLALTGWHKGPGQWAVIAVVLLHVAAIAFYAARRRRNLTLPMLTGDQLLAGAVPPDAPASVDTAATRGLALAVFAACAGLVGWAVTRLGG